MLLRRMCGAPAGAPGSGHAAPRVVLGVLLGLLGAGSAAAQSPNVLISLSGDDATPFETVRDQDILFHAPGGMAHVEWPSETLALFAGDKNGANPLHFVFNDVDAIGSRVGGSSAASSLLISLSTDEDGFKDGDILDIGPGGFEVYIPEADFITATGATDGNVDVDAFQLDQDGTILFSFADNEASSLLSGDTPGVISDGDILRWVPGISDAVILYKESQVNAMVSHALGVTTTTTDTTGLARNPATGDILFSVQSPTAQDASVFSTANGGSLLAGQAEADMGFTGSPELDGLDVPLWTFPALTVSKPNPAAGDSLTMRLAGATPDAPYILLASFKMGAPQLVLAGWGTSVLASDAALIATLNSAPSLLMVPDALGNASLSVSVPAAFPPTDFVLQALKPGPAPQASNPLVIEVAQ